MHATTFTNNLTGHAVYHFNYSKTTEENFKKEGSTQLLIVVVIIRLTELGAFTS